MSQPSSGAGKCHVSPGTYALGRLREAAVRPERAVVIGTGVAGLSAAFALSGRGVPVTLLTAGAAGAECSSDWAQGGLAAAVGVDDSPTAHALDTMAAGDGLCDPSVVERVTAAAPEVVRRLLRLGVPLQRNDSGELSLGLEGGHRARRVVHAGGDQSGHEITATLVDAVRHDPLVTLIEHTLVTDVLVHEERVVGVLTRTRARTGTVSVVLPTAHVVIATGGAAGLFAHTTNPTGLAGSGLALGLRAGAVVRDLELVQFHPTALDVGVRPMPLVSEAVRGEGAHLVLADGTRVLDNDLDTRDKVARAVFAHTAAGRQVYLDTASTIGAGFHRAFPTVTQACLRAGIDPRVDLVPVRPAAHYHMGGIEVDSRGRTAVLGLWATGEVASTGLHGANRLASNSLLEGIAWGPWLAEDIAGGRADGPRPTELARNANRAAGTTGRTASASRGTVSAPVHFPHAPDSDRVDVSAVLSAHAGVLRNGSDLRSALKLCAQWCRTDDRALVATLVVMGALWRAESRGGHYRSDHRPSSPTASNTAASLGHSRATLADALAVADGDSLTPDLPSHLARSAS